MMVIRQIPATVLRWEHANYSILIGGLTLGFKQQLGYITMMM